AAQVATSPRTLARRFGEEFGVTPKRFVLEMRVESARRRLEQTTLPLEKIAAVCGFSNAENMRRAFLHTLGVAPHDYRTRFRTAGTDLTVTAPHDTLKMENSVNYPANMDNLPAFYANHI
ncbi:MAG: transcriptional regulator, partial [Halothiobacillaceae bacterium]